MTRAAIPGGLMAFWADIEPGDLSQFTTWHNCEHIPERVAIPGFVAGRRYRDQSGAPRFLMMYETQDAGVLGSDAYTKALNDPTPWTRESIGHFRNVVRNIYRLAGGVGTSSLAEAPYLVTTRFNLETDASLDSACNVWLPDTISVSGVQGVRLYEIDEAISGIPTTERKIYGGGPGAQRYLLFVEVTTAAADRGRALPRIMAELDALPGALEARRDEDRDALRIDYALQSTPKS